MPGSIVLNNVSYALNKYAVLRTVNIAVNKGDIVLVSGRSGHGKSTLLEVCAGLLTPDSGSVLWDEEDIRSFSQSRLFLERHKIGFVFQLHALISNHTIFDNIALPLRSRNGYNEKDIRLRVRQVLEDFGLFNIDSFFPEALSVGQLKLASVARSLISDPEIVFLDEPLSGLDPLTARGMLNVLYEYRRKRELTIVMITHDMNIWQEFTTRKFVLESGSLLENNEKLDK